MIRARLLLLLLACSGCAGTYTSIRKNDDGTYMLTRVKGGFMGSTHGTVFQCGPMQGGGLRCAEIDSP